MAYAPYVREMNLWFKHVDKVKIVAPLSRRMRTSIDMAYKHDKINFNSVPRIEFTNLFAFIISLFKLPIIMIKIYRVCKASDHIHLRCPGNMGLLGCVVQTFFPSKPKTAKYAGNWDPKAKQPWSYKLQRYILSNTKITKNMNVLVYGDWPKSSKNIVPFFTASFSNNDKPQWQSRDYSKAIKFIFVGALVEGKRPLFAIKIIEQLAKDFNISLDIYGDGPLMPELTSYVDNNNLRTIVKFHGAVELDQLKSVYQNAHFLILASKSEGWPKAIAEAMFFGVIPIATKISSVPSMLNYGERGVLIDAQVQNAVQDVKKALQQVDLHEMSKKAQQWSQQYTLEKFESEIQKLLIK
ncbi:MAG: glycosyltransferase family 4 protein [Winogradskyella sp.]|nr:glycosyltransferase family 4 protein [Winogradskyella sp.]